MTYYRFKRVENMPSTWHDWVLRCWGETYASKCLFRNTPERRSMGFRRFEIVCPYHRSRMRGDWFELEPADVADVLTPVL